MADNLLDQQARSLHLPQAGVRAGYETAAIGFFQRAIRFKNLEHRAKKWEPFFATKDAFSKT
jgi:hypothetical protein